MGDEIRAWTACVGPGLVMEASKSTSCVSTAVLSECGTYRYSLERRWGDGATMAFVMLNPSTADAFNDDPTIRRCVGFAKREGAGGIKVVNLFAFRSTNPKALKNADDPVGPDNLEHVLRVAGECEWVVAAWGGSCPRGLVSPVARALAELDRPLLCLGVTKYRFPRHPLYVPGDAPLSPFHRWGS